MKTELMKVSTDRTFSPVYQCSVFTN